MIDWRDRISLIGAIFVSALVLAGFATICTLLFFREVPTGSQNIAFALFGSLGTMAGAVVQYWTGSNSSSQKKDATIAAAVNKAPGTP